jgi:hypothetical protein
LGKFCRLKDCSGEADFSVALLTEASSFDRNGDFCD